jgi:hypothetical protein
MSLTNCELLISPVSADTVVVVDAPAETYGALADAAAYRHQTLSLGALDVDVHAVVRDAGSQALAVDDDEERRGRLPLLGKEQSRRTSWRARSLLSRTRTGGEEVAGSRLPTAVNRRACQGHGVGSLKS